MFLITFAFVAEGVVREQSLIARWSFDEGNGSVAVDSTGGGLDLLLSANAKWGSIDVNNTFTGFMTYSLLVIITEGFISLIFKH